MKRMFAMMEVQEFGKGGWAIPIDPILGRPEQIDVSRVIYADEMNVSSVNSIGAQYIQLRGVSPTPETDLWEEWCEKMAEVLALACTRNIDTDPIQKKRLESILTQLRKMPRGKP